MLRSTKIGISLLLLSSVTVTGCATLVTKDHELPVEEEAMAEEEVFQPVSKEMLVPNSEYSSGSGKPRYRVWYGTNRKPNYDVNDNFVDFSEDRDNQLHYGKCYLEIPKSHVFGSVGSSWIRRVVTLTDDRIKLEHIERVSAANFFQDMQDKLSTRSGLKQALVYIHGYNVGFEEAAIRAAQIGFDLKVGGITAFFSWPSKDSTRSYVADTASIQASELFLEEFLERIHKESGADEVHIIAHSMGNRGLLRSMERVAKSLQSQGLKFGQIFLAAPDVDKDLFERLADVYPGISKRTTLYVSSKDLALKASSIVHDYARAGFYPPITVVPGIDTIKVSNIDVTLLGHSYYAEAGSILKDMFTLMLDDVSPNFREGLRLLGSGSETHWEFIQPAQEIDSSLSP